MLAGQFYPLKDTHREKHRQIKFERLRKVRIWAFDSLVHQINPLEEVLKLKQNFPKNKVANGKTPFFVIGPFCTHHFICLTLASDMAVLYGDGAFSILVLSTKR